MRLADKVVLVTGSTTGIGKAIVKKCVEEGARVIVHGRDRDTGEELIRQLGPQKAFLILDDLADPESSGRIIDRTIDHYGKLDAIVNNAAFVASSNISTTENDLLRTVFQVNTFTPFLLIKAALTALTESRGAVLNIGSVNAWCGEPNLLAYSMTKGAMMTMSRNLGDVLFRENGVRVNQINPGWILTEKEIERKRSHGLSETWYEDLPETYAPSGRIILPEEIANAVIYWISDEAGPISGQVVELEQYPLIGRNLAK